MGTCHYYIYYRRDFIENTAKNFGLFLKHFGVFGLQGSKSTFLKALHLDLGRNNAARSRSRGIDTTSGYGISTIFDFVHSEALLVLKFLAAPFANDVCWLRMYIFDMHANPILGISD